MGDRLRCAVFGKFGIQQGPAMHPGLDAPVRVAADARRVTAPVLFHLQMARRDLPPRWPTGSVRRVGIARQGAGRILRNARGDQAQRCGSVARLRVPPALFQRLRRGSSSRQ
jgi:hypothetical protein